MAVGVGFGPGQSRVLLHGAGVPKNCGSVPTFLMFAHVGRARTTTEYVRVTLTVRRVLG